MAVLGNDRFHASGLVGTVAMFQIYSQSALNPERARCVYDGGQRLVQSGRLAQEDNTACRAAFSTGCTDRAAINGPERGSTTTSVVAVDDGSCVFEQPDRAATERGIVRVTREWQTLTLSGSYTKPLVFCNLLSRSSTTQVRQIAF